MYKKTFPAIYLFAFLLCIFLILPNLLESNGRIEEYKILNDKNQELIIFENDEKEIIGTLQLTFIPYLTYQGGIRAQIEAVRIHNNFRGKGFGKQLFEWAINLSLIHI